MKRDENEMLPFPKDIKKVDQKKRKEKKEKSNRLTGISRDIKYTIALLQIIGVGNCFQLQILSSLINVFPCF